MLFDVTMQTGAFVGMLIAVVLAVAIGTFFLARWFFKRELAKNPPINEKMIRAMFRSMGRPCSEAQIRQIMKNVNSQK
ncbi:MAG: YneF family protein [Bacilli bacterium]|nr:YneF family protein [Bacilli bacterium]